MTVDVYFTNGDHIKVDNVKDDPSLYSDGVSSFYFEGVYEKAGIYFKMENITYIKCVEHK